MKQKDLIEFYRKKLYEKSSDSMSRHYRLIECVETFENKAKVTTGEKSKTYKECANTLMQAIFPDTPF